MENSIIAWCRSHVEMLSSPNKIKSSNTDYFAAIERMNFTEIPVDCAGSVQLLNAPANRSFKVEWSMEATLIADWNEKHRKFSGVNFLGIAPIVLGSASARGDLKGEEQSNTRAEKLP